MIEVEQTRPPELIRGLDRLGVGTSVSKARNPNGEGDDQPDALVAEPNTELATSTCQVETGACPAMQTDAIVLPTDLTTSAIPPIESVPGIPIGAGREDGKAKGFKRPPFLPPRPSREESASGNGPLP